MFQTVSMFVRRVVAWPLLMLVIIITYLLEALIHISAWLTDVPVPKVKVAADHD